MTTPRYAQQSSVASKAADGPKRPPGMANDEHTTFVDLMLQQAAHSAKAAMVANSPSSLLQAASETFSRSHAAVTSSSLGDAGKLTKQLPRSLDAAFMALFDLFELLKEHAEPSVTAYSHYIQAAMIEFNQRFEPLGWRPPRSIAEGQVRAKQAVRAGAMHLSTTERGQLGRMHLRAAQQYILASWKQLTSGDLAAVSLARDSLDEALATLIDPHFANDAALIASDVATTEQVFGRLALAVEQSSPSRVGELRALGMTVDSLLRLVGRDPHWAAKLDQAEPAKNLDTAGTHPSKPSPPPGRPSGAATAAKRHHVDQAGIPDGANQPAIASPDALVRNRGRVQVPSLGATRSDGYTGDPAYDKEPICDREPEREGCHLLDRPRHNVLQELLDNILVATENQKDACIELKAEILAKKDEELGLLPQLMIATLAAFVGNVFTPAALLVRTTIVGDALAGDALSDDSVKTVIKAATGFYSKKVDASAKREGADSAKQAHLALLDQVQNSVDATALEFRRYARQDVTDAQLLLLSFAMHPARHQTTLYKAALRKMLDDFSRSGVAKIGRGLGDLNKTPGRDGARHFEDRRVAWAVVKGQPHLFFQHANAEDPYSDSTSYGEKSWTRDRPSIGRPVPREFWDAALQKQREKWGADASFLTDPDDLAAAHAALAKEPAADTARGAP
ncbi:MAG TPA: hypothetical protein VK427_27795 [Kofleriaceae bacterium]|nr:hypothetical protein [Kofleriaceae bacterium]